MHRRMAQRLRRRFRPGAQALRVRTVEPRGLGIAQHHLSADRHQVSQFLFASFRSIRSFDSILFFLRNFRVRVLETV